MSTRLSDAMAILATQSRCLRAFQPGRQRRITDAYRSLAHMVKFDSLETDRATADLARNSPLLTSIPIRILNLSGPCYFIWEAQAPYMERKNGGFVLNLDENQMRFSPFNVEWRKTSRNVRQPSALPALKRSSKREAQVQHRTNSHMCTPRSSKAFLAFCFEFPGHRIISARR